MNSLHDVKIAGLNLREILKCVIDSQIGDHSTLLLIAYVDEEDFLYEVPDCQSIEVYLNEGKEKKILFSGIVTGIQISEAGQLKTVCIEGKSRSWLMDRTKRSRSFQNSNMHLSELIQEIMQDYQDGLLYYTAPDHVIGGLIVQYEETDWAFLQRVLSLAGLTLTPDSRQEGLKLYAGVPALTETDLSCHILEMHKDMDTYYTLKANGRNVHSSDFTQYWVASEQLLGIFEPVTVQGKQLVVHSCQYAFAIQDMVGIYGLQSPGGLVRSASYPMHLIGVALTGKVVNVSGTKVQVAMNIDGAHTERASHWFPYSTLSASTDGSGWYCMPEIGDDVRIYFPSKQESEAIALSAVSSYDAPSDGSEDRMGNPNSRYLRTKSGQELALTPNYMRLSCGRGASSVTIQSDGKVIVQSQAMVKADAQEDITLRAEEVAIHVRENFLLHGLSGGQFISSGGGVGVQGSEVKID